MNCKNLKSLKLNLARNNLEDSCIKLLTRTLKKMTNLDFLEIHLYGNKFSPLKVVKFLNAIDMISLKNFIFSY